MKKLLLILTFIFLFITNTYGYVDQNSKTYNLINEKINEIIDNKFEYIEDKYDFILKMKNILDTKYSNSTNESIIILNDIINKNIINYKNDIDRINTLNKIEVGKSTSGIPIYAYYKGDIKKPFILITGNIHGGYEYGAYNTSKYLIDELDKSGKKQWFVIPTLNPDGLKIAQDNNFNNNYYLEGRGNSLDIDLNRNFCTNNYKAGTYTKIAGNNKKVLSLGSKCGEAIETNVINNIFNQFLFSKAIDLHSAGGIIFIPDGTLTNSNVINFANQIKSYLGDQYDFYPNYSNSYEKEQMIKKYEFDEGFSGRYTGLMSEYIWEKYKIPSIIVELKYHGKIEKNIINFKNLF